MFNQLYKDMEELHRLVKPFRYRVTLDRWSDSLAAFNTVLWSAVASTIKATKSITDFKDKIKKA